MILLYIDPGTGSMLFSVLLGIFTASLFATQKLWYRLKTIISGGRVKRINGDKIPVVIFSDDKRYWNTFEPICDELDKRGIRAEYWTVSKDDPGIEHSYTNIQCKYIGSINKAITRLNVLNASICLSTTPGLEVYQWKRSNNTECYIHIVHAVGGGTLYRMFGMDFFDEIMYTGDFTENNIRKLEKIRNLKPKKLIDVGVPYLDNMKKRAESRTFNKGDGINILVSPTWGVNSLFNQMGDKLIDSLIDTGHNITIRPHPQSYISEKELIERLMRKYPEGDRIHWNSDNDNINVLGCSDIMISDYSGIIYDYMFVFDKPVIYSLPDFRKDPYDAWFIEEDPITISVLPDIAYEITPGNVGNIKHVIDCVLLEDVKKSARMEIKERLWHNRGESAIKCVNYLEDKLGKESEKR